MDGEYLQELIQENIQEYRSYMGMQLDLIEILQHINPSALNYTEWTQVGMALKHEGYPVQVWDQWSSSDLRYKPRECEKKWNTFRGAVEPVSGGTILKLAKDHGYTYDFGHEFDWNDEIEKEKDDLVVIDKNWVEAKEVIPPKSWQPVSELIKYLETLFDSTENVGYVTKCWDKDGKKMPTKGHCDRTAGQLIQALSKCNGNICDVIGDYDQEVGAWIRFNPLDGKDVKNENVTEFKYALVESDELDIEKQNAIVRELELPIACLVHSGGKSIHAIVKVDAYDYSEYRKRVDYLYNICNKNGLKIDTQNRNPSRLSRMPGIIRNDKKQFLVDTNIGKNNWQEWYEWIESINDDLPEPEGLEEYWDDLPKLADPLIDGVLRQGHKMLIAGPSKAGKSFALIEMCIAIAEGKKWFGWTCTQGKILYVNLELDRASCLHRFKDVYQGLGYRPNNLSNIDIWNLRGKSIPMDKLAPKLIRRALKKNYIGIVIDPIYKVITGDENSADQMANFCNQFDKVCTELGSAVIYCHHHSKGSQGGKRSMDRASGSGVFARDPDALLDLMELEPTENLYKSEENKAICDACFYCLNKLLDDWEDDVSQDAMCSSSQMLSYCKKKLTRSQEQELLSTVEVFKKNARNKTAWRIEGTLREFQKFEPINLWFDYPVHKIDHTGTLNDISTEEKPPWQKAKESRKTPDDKKNERIKSLELAYEALKIEGEVSIKSLEEYFTLSTNAIRKRIDEHPDFERKDGFIVRKS